MVAAPLNDTVVLLRSRISLLVTATLSVEPSVIDILQCVRNPTSPCSVLTVCLAAKHNDMDTNQYSTDPLSSITIIIIILNSTWNPVSNFITSIFLFMSTDVKYSITLDSLIEIGIHKRFHFITVGSPSVITVSEVSVGGISTCVTHSIQIRVRNKNRIYFI